MMTFTHSQQTNRTGGRHNWRVTLLAAPLLLLALAGCSSSGAAPVSPAPGSSSSSGGAGQPTTEAEFSAARDAYDLKLAQCFRDLGLDVADPKPGEGITDDNPEIQAAYPECSAKIGDPPSNKGLTIDSEMLAKLLVRANCLRDLGYDIKEPTSTDPGFIGAEVGPKDFETCSKKSGV